MLFRSLPLLSARQATLVEPMRSEFTYGDSLMPRWMVGLYRVKASIARTDGQVKADWEQVMAGWQLATLRPDALKGPGP